MGMINIRLPLEPLTPLGVMANGKGFNPRWPEVGLVRVPDTVRNHGKQATGPRVAGHTPIWIEQGIESAHDLRLLGARPRSPGPR